MGVFIIGLVLIFGGAAVDKQAQLTKKDGQLLKLHRCVEAHARHARRCLR